MHPKMCPPWSSLLNPTTAGLVFHTLSLEPSAFRKLFSMFDLYSGNTGRWRWNKLALPTYYDTLYVSVLFDMRDSGGFLTFHSVLSFSVYDFLANSVSIRDSTIRVSFPNNSNSYRLLLRSLFRYKSILSLVRA